MASHTVNLEPTGSSRPVARPLPFMLHKGLAAGHSMRPQSGAALRQTRDAAVQALRDQDAHAVEREHAVQSLRTSELDQGRSCRRVSRF